MPGMGGMGGMRGHHENKGPSRQMQLDVTLEEVMLGSTIPFRIHRKKYTSSNKCSSCNGQGRVVQQMNLGVGIISQNVVSCSSCQGSGHMFADKDVLLTEEVIQVPLPKGIPEGKSLVIRSKADEYPGKQNGDIILVVAYKKHEFYRPSTKNVLDVECTIPLSLSEFLLGFKKQLTLLDKSVLLLKQPEGTPLTSIIDRPIEKLVPEKGFCYKGTRGNLNICFTVHTAGMDASTQSLIKTVFSPLAETSPLYIRNNGDSGNIVFLQYY